MRRNLTQWRFVQTPWRGLHWKRNQALGPESRRQAIMPAGKRGFGFRRFKKCWRAKATRAKAHRLDWNWLSLAYKAQCSNHWAKTANRTQHFMKHSSLWSWNEKRKCQPRKHVGECCCYSPTLALGSAMEIWLWVINEMCLQRLNLSSTQDSVSNHDLALLQQAMNAEGICAPRDWEINTPGRISLKCLHGQRVLLE